MVVWRIVKGEEFEGGMNSNTMKHYIEFASRHNIQYLIIDAGWYCPEIDAWEKPLDQDITKVRAKDLNLEEVIRYAEQYGVKIILWVHCDSLQKQMAEALPLYQRWGVAGIKVDSYGREDQKFIDFCWEVAEKAAEHNLVVNFHGAYKPTGMRRTYPNVLTREAVSGLEWSKWGDKCNLEHEVTIPFTRMLAGPMDFTPGAFASEWYVGGGVKGTRAHQLAMYVVYESPLQMLADYPAAYEGQTGIEFLEKVPATWDKTEVLDGRVGDYITIARKNGDEWYIGSMTDENARRLTIPLKFLDQGRYTAYIYEDSYANPIYVTVRKIIVTSSDTIITSLAPGGGAAVRITPVV